MSNLKTPVAAALCLVLMTGAITACGGGGGGSGGGGGGSSSSSATGVDMGTLSVVDDTVSMKIRNVSSGQYLAIAGASQTAGAKLGQAADSGNKELLWHAITMDSTQYNIENMLTHQVAGIENASTTAGAEALQWADNGINDHLWTFLKLGNGNYLIRNVRSGLYLQTNAGGPVTQETRPSTGTACTCQEWTLSLTSTRVYALPKTVSGAGVDVHDPNLIVDTAGTYWLYGTHNTLASSTDLTTFTKVATGSFATDYSWWASKNTTGGGGRTDLWAPSVMYANGKYYHYYSIPVYGTPSVAGTNMGAEAVIALATGPTPTGPWTDAGEIIASCGTRPGCTTKYNAIDPAPYKDDAGNWYMVFGSWEDGMHVIELDPVTGLRKGSVMYDIAKRPGGVEGPFIFPWVVNGTKYYYYFGSANPCCNADSRYRILVGRSTSPTGPFFDRGGLNLVDGGGTILLSAHGNIKGPGGNSVVNAGGVPTLVYHYYDGASGGAPKLGLNALGFDAEGWPFVQ
ncbi:family 43 glycosylhydrolase [Asticcacaulis sp. AC460]|uniref:family 43 glycosylhydrolase n=1 Tax=Asticcacaulis sp. AC460 TaxID=1282360 RepID=UPI0003FDD13B|nr:family 43 glycosylhydrolase [Asticcacaulis sp. AC460]